jgi:hypothetical protein
MENVIFKPWVGSNYANSKSKIFVLGESHYGDIKLEEQNDFTNYIVKLFLDYKTGKIEHEGWMTTFSKFSNILNRKDLESNELIEFWDSIVFYNYVQASIEHARLKPSWDDFDKSYAPFLSVLSELEPKTIIVWGERLWEKIPMDNIEIIDGKHFLKYNNVNAEIFQIYHPSSSAFNYSYWDNLNINLID